MTILLTILCVLLAWLIYTDGSYWYRLGRSHGERNCRKEVSDE